MTGPVPSCETHPIVMWELTRACDLHCSACTIGATERRGTNELSTYEAYKAIDQIADLAPREFIITGGDPLAREDIVEIVDYARRRGLDPALVVSPTPGLSANAMARLARNGLRRIVFSIDGATPEVHHAVQGVAGTFAATLRALRDAESAGLAIEINTLITRRNAEDLAAIADLVRPAGIIRWNLYFLVPLIASTRPDMIDAVEAERLFATIDEIRSREDFAVRVVEAPHYRRYQLERNLEAHLVNNTTSDWSDFSGYEPAAYTRQHLMGSAVDGAHGFVFISHAGDVRYSEFLLFSAGNLRYRPLGAIYHSSGLFAALRDPANFPGKCGRCEFRHLCGGSRARAWAMEGNMFADDPLCVYEPGALVA